MSFKLRGKNELIGALKERAEMADVKNVVKMNTSEMHRKAQRLVPVDTGNLRRMTGIEFENEGMTGRVQAATNYASYVEYGTRFMDAQPFIRPAFHKQKPQFEADMRRLMK